MPYQEMIRQKILEDIYGRMSDKEKEMFVLLSMQEQNQREIMDALRDQQARIGHLAQEAGKKDWLTDFGSDVAANFFTDGLIWLARTLFRR